MNHETGVLLYGGYCVAKPGGMYFVLTIIWGSFFILTCLSSGFHNVVPVALHPSY